MDVVRAVANPDEMGALLKILAQSFTMSPERAPGYVDQVGRENFRILERDGRIVAGLATFWMGHWIGGRSVPTCGIAAVGVLPEVRGTGVGRALMLGVLREARERGVALSTLYASTQRLYRSVGYEQAGHRNQYRIALRSLRPGPRTLQVSALEPDGIERMRPLYDAWARTQQGVLDRNDGIWQRVTGGESVYGVVLGDPGAPEGYALWQQVRDGKGFYDLVLRDRVSTTPAAERQLWTVLADHRSMSSWLTMPGPGNDPSLIHLEEWRSAEFARFERWMLRVVDVQGALRARGWPAVASGAVVLQVQDDDFPEQAGSWELSVCDGAAQVEPGGTGGLALDRRALAPLFSGLYSASQLATEGLIAGSARDLAVADGLFASAEPWMPDHF